MTEQPFRHGDATKLAHSAVRAHIIVAMRSLLDDADADLTVVDGGNVIYARKYGRTIEITTRDVTDQM